MPPITQEKLYEAFGLTPPQEEGAKEQVIAEPAAEETGVQETQEEGANEQTVAESAGESSTQEETAQEEAAEPAQQVQSAEERRANAARRRQQEQQEAVQKAVNEALTEERRKQSDALASFFAKAGLKNTITGEPIKTMEEFRQWSKQHDDAQLDSELKKGRLNAELLEQAIGRHPAVQQAQQLVQQQAEQTRAQQQAQEKERIDQQLGAIRELNPEIKELADILAMPTAGEFRKYVAKGCDFLDAYRLANMDAISEQKAQRAKEAAAMASRGKSHLEATGNSRGAGAVSVPGNQMAMFKRMNPKATPAEIQKFYNNYLKRQGG